MLISHNNTGSRADHACLHRDCIIYSALRVFCRLICIRLLSFKAYAHIQVKQSRCDAETVSTSPEGGPRRIPAPEFDLQVRMLSKLHRAPRLINDVVRRRSR